MSDILTRPRRRDDDPVREYKDNRIWYWTGGRPGHGIRKPLRFKGAKEMHERAAELRAQFAAPVGTLPGQSFRDAMKSFLDYLKENNAPEGTVRKYRSGFNAHVPKVIVHARCADLSIIEWTEIFDGLAGESRPVIDGVRTMLLSFCTYAYTHGYLTTPEPFGPSKLRNDVVARVSNARPEEEVEPTPESIRLDHCPTPENVDELADAFEVVYPGYGRLLVYLAYASGMRMAELLALRVSDVRILADRTEIDVRRQLDRYNAWPATKPPKNNKARTTIVWEYYLWVLEELIEKAESRTKDADWLFPRINSEKAWLANVGELSRVARKACAWPWKFHWLRHAFASVSMAPVEVGGYGRDAMSVSLWLGHAKITTTLEKYTVRQADDTVRAKEGTALPPGHIMARRT